MIAHLHNILAGARMEVKWMLQVEGSLHLGVRVLATALLSALVVGLWIRSSKRLKRARSEDLRDGLDEAFALIESLAGAVDGLAGASRGTCHQPACPSNEGCIYFNSADGLVPHDINETEDIYQYEPSTESDADMPSPTSAKRGSRAHEESPDVYDAHEAGAPTPPHPPTLSRPGCSCFEGVPQRAVTRYGRGVKESIPRRESLRVEAGR